MTELILSALTAAVLVVGGFAAKALDKFAATNADNKIVKEIASAAADAVAMVSQTYVDGLKAAGNFDAAAQKQALSMALAACLASLSQSAQDYIERTYGDVNSYLTTKIEAEVRAQQPGRATLDTAAIHDAAALPGRRAPFLPRGNTTPPPCQLDPGRAGAFLRLRWLRQGRSCRPFRPVG